MGQFWYQPTDFRSGTRPSVDAFAMVDEGIPAVEEGAGGVRWRSRDGVVSTALCDGGEQCLLVVEVCGVQMTSAVLC